MDRKEKWGREAARLYKEFGLELRAAMIGILHTDSGGLYQRASIKVREILDQRKLNVSPEVLGEICSYSFWICRNQEETSWWRRQTICSDSIRNR